MNLHSCLLSFFAIFSNIVCALNRPPLSPREQVIPTIIEYSKKIKKEHDIDLRLYGVSCAGEDKIYDGKVHEINLGYSVEKKMNVEEARKLFYTLVDGLLDVFNSNEMFREAFYHYPIGYEDFYCYLSFDYEDKGYLQKNNVSMIAVLYNKIKYFIVEEDGGNAGLEMKQITPDVSIVTGISPKTRCITKKLPEE